MLASVVEVDNLNGPGKCSATRFQIHSAPSPRTTFFCARLQPRFLGVWLALAGFAWVILSLTGVLLPQYQDKVRNAKLPTRGTNPYNEMQENNGKSLQRVACFCTFLPSVLGQNSDISVGRFCSFDSVKLGGRLSNIAYPDW